MKNLLCGLLVLSIGAHLLGCQGQVASTPKAATTGKGESKGSEATVSKEDSAPGSLEEHPEYGNWKQFGVGTIVRRKKTISNDKETVTVTTQLRLVEKDEKHITVETQIDVERSLSGKEVNPPFQVDFPASFRLPPSVKMEQFLLPSLKAKQVGEESVQIGNDLFDSLKFEWTEKNEAGPMSVKYWQSQRMPGRFVRQEQNTESLNTKSLEEVIEVKLVKDP